MSLPKGKNDSKYAVLGSEIGAVTLVNKKRRTLKAFEDKISAFSMNNEASLIAITNSDGCTIKVYGTDDLELLFEFTRGRNPS